jgi:hypothetical protein
VETCENHSAVWRDDRDWGGARTKVRRDSRHTKHVVGRAVRQEHGDQPGARCNESPVVHFGDLSESAAGRACGQPAVTAAEARIEASVRAVAEHDGA